MPNDNDMTRLLYAILSQKCLKDIDWNKVANDPVLAQRITNGHAARMRYSRFKKQIDGTATVRRPRNSNGPRRKYTRKDKDKKVKQDAGSGDEGEEIKVKMEMGRDNATPGPQMGDLQSMSPELPYVKMEPGPSSYFMATPSPTPGYDGGSESMAPQHMSDLNSFNNYQLSSSPPAMYQPSTMHQARDFEMDGGMGMGMGMGMVGLDVWQHQSQPQQCDGFVTGAETACGVLVKKEERWDNSYLD